MKKNEMDKVFEELHHIDYNDEADDYYKEHKDTINKLKNDRDQYIQNSAPLLKALEDLVNSLKAGNATTEDLIELLDSQDREIQNNQEDEEK